MNILERGEDKMEGKNYNQKPKSNYEKYFLAEAAMRDCFVNIGGKLSLSEEKKSLAITLLGGVHSGEALYDLFINPEMAKSSPYALEQAIKIFSKESQLAMYEEKIEKLYKFYGDETKKLSPEIRKKINFVYDSFKDKKYGEIYTEFVKASEIIDSAEKGEAYKKEEIENAKKTYEKYETFMQVSQELHDLKLETLKYKTISKRKKTNLENIVKTIEIPTPKKE